MADNKVIFEVVATAKGFNIVNKQQKNLRNEIDKTTSSQKNLDKQRDKGYGRQQQAMIQTANGTKNFSKLNQTIGGSNGSGALVSTYALLAANVFAATAAFSALRNAAAVEKLGEGLTAFGNETGQSLDLVAAKLKEVTGNAVSLEQAMRTAALSTSAGFGVAEMEGLTRVAKGASLALGRDMGDALDRLTRGAIKLEPEILDELGIMVRLDDAVETYAAQLGKAASGLTRFERQQAFMNAIITEGESKFGGIADTLQPNAYDNLSAALADLSKNMLTFLNKALIPILNFFMSSPALFMGGILAMSGGITKRLIPSISDLTAKSAQSAEQSRLTAQAFAEGTDEQVAGARAVMTPTKESAKAYNELTDKLKAGTQTSRELGSAKSSLTKAINAETKAQKAQVDAGLKVSKQAKRELADMTLKRKKLDALTGAEISASAAKKVNIALANELFFAMEADVLAEAGRQTHGWRDALQNLNATFWGVITTIKAYWIETFKAHLAQKTTSLSAKILAFTMASVKAAFRLATLSVKAFGIAVLKFLPYLGIAMIAFDILVGTIKMIGRWFGFFTEETKAAREAQKSLGTVLDGISEKMEAYEKIAERATSSTKLITAEYKVLGGIAKSSFDEALKAQRAFNEEGVKNMGTDSDKAKTAVGVAGNRAIKGKDYDPNFIKERLADVDAFAVAIDRMSDESDKVANIVEKKLGKSYNDFAQDFLAAGNSAEELAKISRSTMVEIEKQVNGVAQASEGLSTALKEAEKEAGKFLRTFAVKSKFDGLISSIAGVNTELAGLIEQAKEGDIDATAIVAESIRALGPQVSLLAGSKLGPELDIIKEKSQKLQEARMASLRATGLIERKIAKNTVKRLERQLNLQELIAADIFKKELPGLQKKLLVLQEMELAYKREVKALKSIQKGAKEASKDGIVKLATNQLNIDILEREKNLIKANLNMNAETLRQAEMKMKSGVLEKDLEETLRDAVIQKRNGEQKISDITKDQIRAKTLSQEITLEEVKNTQKLFNLTKELTNLTLDGAEKRNKINKFRLGENLETNAKEAAQTFEIAQKRIEMSKLEAEIKFAVIEAEYALLAARVATEQDLIGARLESLKTAAKESQGVGFAAVPGVGPVGEVTTEGEFGGGGDKALLAKLQDFAAKNQKQFEETKLQGFKERADAYAQMAATVSARMTEQLTGGEINRLETLSKALGNAVDIGGKSLGISKEILEKTIGNLDLDLTVAAQTFSQNLGKNLLEQAGGGSALATAFQTTTTNLIGAAINSAVAKRIELAGDNEDGSNDKAIADLDATIDKLENKMPSALAQAAESMQILANVSRSIFGEDGILISGIAQFSANIVGAFDQFSKSIDEAKGDKLDTLASKLELVGNITASLGALSQAYGQQKVKEVDQAIEAEKKRDGKSKESMARIAALEKKKDVIAKKNFDRNKKIQMASTIINTATAVVRTLADAGPFAMPLAIAIGAMGAMQLALIAKTQYQSTGGGDTAAPATAINIGGKRSNKVDVSQGASSGETAYLRGGSGVGSNANSFTPGGAMGRKGYADGGMLVGERGPEVVTKEEIIPNYALGGEKSMNLTFNVNAVDAQSVQELLTNNQGAVVGAIRNAANSYGQDFLPDVNVGYVER